MKNQKENQVKTPQTEKEWLVWFKSQEEKMKNLQESMKNESVEEDDFFKNL